MVSETDTDSDTEATQTPDAKGSLRDSPVTVILVVLLLSLALVGAVHAVFAPSADVLVNTNDDGSATVTVKSVSGYEDIVLKYNETAVTLNESDPVVIPDETEYKIVGVIGGTETVLRTGAT